MWFFFKGQELPLQYFKSFKLCLKNVPLNSQKPYQNLGTHCDCLVIEFLIAGRRYCKSCADAPWFPISCNLLKDNIVQVLLNCLQNMESVEIFQFQNFMRSALVATHSGQTRTGSGDLSQQTCSKCKEQVLFLQNLQCVCVKEAEIKGRGRSF